MTNNKAINNYSRPGYNYSFISLFKDKDSIVFFFYSIEFSIFENY